MYVLPYPIVSVYNQSCRLNLSPDYVLVTDILVFFFSIRLKRWLSSKNICQVVSVPSCNRKKCGCDNLLHIYIISFDECVGIKLKPSILGSFAA